MANTLTERITKLTARYEKKAKEQQAILDRNAAITQEELEQAKSLQAEAKSLAEEIGKLRETEALKSENAKHLEFVQTAVRPVPFEGAQGVTVHGMTRAGETQLSAKDGRFLVDQYGEGLLDEKTEKLIRSDEYKRAWRSYLRLGERMPAAKGAEFKILQEGADVSGGFLVPEDILARIIQKQPTPTRLNGMVTQLNTSRDALTLPKVNYPSAGDDSSGILFTTGIRATWTGEVPASATTARVTDPTFASVRVPIYTAMMSMPITNDMIEDSMFPLAQWAADKFAETVMLLYDQMIVSGTGIGQPAGVLVNPGGTGQPAVISMGNPINADNVVKMPYQLPEQYDHNAAWIFNKISTGMTIAQLKDAQSRYLWGQGYQDSGLSALGPKAERGLINYPVRYSQFMPNVGANNYPIIFGDMTGYYLVNRIGFSIQVLRELYAETNQVLLLGRLRFGGQVVEDWKLKIGQQA